MPACCRAHAGHLLDHRPREVVIVDGARYATNFLYNQRRPLWRRQTCPRTSRPVMLRLGMMTRRRCQVVGLAVRRSNPNLRMLMVVNLIDAMLTHLAQAARRRHRPQQASWRPPSAFTIVAPAATAKITLPRGIRSQSPRPGNHSESVGHSGQRNPDFDLSYYYLVVTAAFLPAVLHHYSRTLIPDTRAKMGGHAALCPRQLKRA